MNKNTCIYKLLKWFYRIIFPLPSKEEMIRRKQQEDYEYLRRHGVDTQLGYVELYGLPIINIAPGAHIVIKKGVILISESTYNFAGINHPVILSAECKGAEIVLNEGVGLSGNSLVAVERIEVGENTMLGANSNIYDTDFHPIEAAHREIQRGISDAPHGKVYIGKQCWIGANSTILKGVSIGDETVIGAMSLINQSLPSHVLAAGVPAKVIKKI